MSGLKAIFLAAKAAEKHLREEADFNMSWIDGRRGKEEDFSASYRARRLEVAEERQRWADAIEALIKRAS